MTLNPIESGCIGPPHSPVTTTEAELTWLYEPKQELAAPNHQLSTLNSQQFAFAAPSPTANLRTESWQFTQAENS
jgi:hypothetical protein